MPFVEKKLDEFLVAWFYPTSPRIPPKAGHTGNHGYLFNHEEKQIRTEFIWQDLQDIQDMEDMEEQQ